MTFGRVLVVTGASSGIGKAVCLLAAAAGDRVVLVARGREALDRTAGECKAAGAESTLVVPGDVADDAAMKELAAEVVAVYGRVDVVVNSAGVVAYGRAEEIPPEVFDRVLATNLRGSANVARHFLPVMRRQGGGDVVLLGSVVGHLAAPSITPYVVSKWGVRALAQQLRLENRDVPDLRVHYVAPGGVDTPIYEQAANYAGYQGRPLPPVMSPEHVAEVILRRLDRPSPRSQVGLANDVMRLGWSLAPWAYSVLVGPLFRIGATDLTRPVDPGPGNVLAPNSEGNRLHGNPAAAASGIARNLLREVQGWGKRLRP